MAQSARPSSPVFHRPSASVPSAPAGEPTGSRPKIGPKIVPPRTTDPEDLAIDRERRGGRGTVSNWAGHAEAVPRIAFDAGCQSLEDLPPFQTTVSVDSTRRIITRNESPDISF